MHPRVLIVGTVPYNKQTSSRAFESYFSNWEKDNLAQIFSNPREPVHGHCGTFYQITDKEMLYRRFRHIDTGTIYYDKDLDDEWKTLPQKKKKSLIDKLYGLGSRKCPINYLFRWWLWKKSFWCTNKLDNWLVSFSPDCVFLAFSDDFFILQIALYVAEKFGVPIISCIGDDYYFNDRKSISPFYFLYRTNYKKLVRKVFSRPGSAVYIGDKIRDKYNYEFGLHGETVYLSSELVRHSFKEINVKAPYISYSGNIRLGRADSLCMIASALRAIDSSYKIHVYSNESEEQYMRALKAHPNIVYCGSVPYSQVTENMYKSDILLVVEGFKKKDVDITRYSLSTKVADSLAVGAAILSLGSLDCGAIDYMNQIDCGPVCTDPTQLENTIRRLLTDVYYQKRNYEKSIVITNNNHTLEHSNRVFENLVNRVLAEFKSNKKLSLKNTITLLISSCDAYSDLWKNHVSLLNEYWIDRDINAFIVTDKYNDACFSNVKIYAAGDSLEMPQRLMSFCKQCKTDYILITLDDYYIDRPIDNRKIENALQLMKKHDLDYLRFWPYPRDKKRIIGTKNSFWIELNGNYKVNLYPAIWKKTFLEKTINESLNAWEYEVSLTKTAKLLNAKCAYSLNGEMHIVDVIRKGKLLHPAKRFLDSKGMHLDRKLISRTLEFKLNAMYYGKEFLPKPILKFLKKFMIKRGHKFISDGI